MSKLISKKILIGGLILSVSCIVILQCSCITTPNSEAKNTVPTVTPPDVSDTKVSESNNQDLPKHIDFKGVSFQSYISSATDIEAIEEEAVILEEETDKPDSVRPRTISVKFKGEFFDRRKDDIFSSKINIYPIKEFREALAKSGRFVKIFDSEIKSLHDIILDGKTEIKELPRIPFYDSTIDIITRVKHITTKNGKGFFCLTQLNIDPSIINNEGLTYMFQGITSDNKYYILATFPVKSKLLPDSYDTEEFRGYSLPRIIRGSKEYAVQEAEYNNYLKSVENLLNKQKSDSFTPDLTEIEETISSLEVDWNA